MRRAANWVPSTFLFYWLLSSRYCRQDLSGTLLRRMPLRGIIPFMNPAVERASILLQQSRYELAEKELRRALVEEPNNGWVHAILSMCQKDQGRHKDAIVSARTAIGLEPDNSVCHYALAAALLADGQPQQAESSVREAIRLDPSDEDNYAMLAYIRYEMNDWAGALAAANEGLKFDPHDSACVNARTMALTKLGRLDEAGETIQGDLARNPENSTSHASLGWNYLHAGEHKKALEHFREALRLDPQNDYARSGMVEALKARYLVYRLMLRYFLWMSRLSRGAQWAVIIGLYVAMKVLRGVEQSNPELAVVIRPLVWAYFIFFGLTWLAEHIFNLLLMASSYGRYALSAHQRAGAVALGLLIASAIGCFAALAIWDWPPLLYGGIGLAMLSLPASTSLGADGRKRKVIGAYTAVLGLILLAAMACFIVQGDANNSHGFILAAAFVIGWVIFTWLANVDFDKKR